ncbi:MAG: hypothetical protein E3J56_01115 [Candidatus Aminicenantes bacterium]|nr:MAG: hypothetical protein E3J56_01115 [Candidatus Aminicenantes bacterium]
MVEYSQEVLNYIKHNFESMTSPVLIQRLNERYGIGLSEHSFKKLLSNMGLRKAPPRKDGLDQDIDSMGLDDS